MAGILKSSAIDLHANGWHFEKHDLAQWRCIQMAGILKSMA
jgi:hypothetical protein